MMNNIKGGAAGVPTAGGAKPKGGGSATRPIGLHQVHAGTPATGMLTNTAAVHSTTESVANQISCDIYSPYRMTVFQGRTSREGGLCSSARSRCSPYSTAFGQQGFTFFLCQLLPWFMPSGWLDRVLFLTLVQVAIIPSHPVPSHLIPRVSFLLPMPS